MNRSMRLAALLITAFPANAAERLFLEVSPQNRADLDSLFATLEQSLEQSLPADDPVVVVLHGEEAFSFTRDHYLNNRTLIDRAARLDAYRMIEVRMCETWMKDNAIGPDDIPAFIEPVRFAPEEIERLEAEGYTPYDSVRI
jgi:intracellular sulfur oxidation DsrE/DsrF family protein